MDSKGGERVQQKDIENGNQLEGGNIMRRENQVQGRDLECISISQDTKNSLENKGTSNDTKKEALEYIKEYGSVMSPDCIKQIVEMDSERSRELEYTKKHPTSRQNQTPSSITVETTTSLSPNR
ncbi:hypothetical protein HAX54_040089, partial [Datura stramonium]|nr:hypothetical protein [Datura stramonium]